jgi:hypothetical protein
MSGMDRAFFYCSQLSVGAGESIYGTASTGEVWLLLEYPHPWGPNALLDSNLSPPVKKHLIKTLKQIPRSRLLLIRQERERTPGIEHALFIAHARENGPYVLKFSLRNYDDLLGLDIASLVAAKGQRDGAVLHGPLFLVCTHGRRDKCCAKFGYPLYKSLRKFAGGGVWQASHVGGDRFAANLLSFPHGFFHGRVRAETGIRIANEYREGRLVLDGYRGRSCYSYPVQAAEFFVRQKSGITAVENLRYLDQKRPGSGQWAVQFLAPSDGAVHEVKVTGAVSEFQNLITCHSTEEKRVIQYTLDSYCVVLR